jgi:serine/threonine protein kinase
LDWQKPDPLREDSGSNAPLQNSPTLMTAMHATNQNVILGTAAYMSPEQARGKSVDKRTDIWAFGAVLFEMLTGQRAFPGEDVTDTLAAVVKIEPKWDALGNDVSARMRQVLRMCLQKDPRQRAQAIGDVRLALEGAFETERPQGVTTSVPASKSRALVPWVAFVTASLTASILAIPALRHLRETQPLEIRTDIATPKTDRPTTFALSPNGEQMVFAALDNSVSRLWLAFTFLDDGATARRNRGRFIAFLVARWTIYCFLCCRSFKASRPEFRGSTGPGSCADGHWRYVE